MVSGAMPGLAVLGSMSKPVSSTRPWPLRQLLLPFEFLSRFLLMMRWVCKPNKPFPSGLPLVMVLYNSNSDPD